ncbi:MAG: hypothetical protein II984_01790 [Clostridia bacterium]|nr:hypothetical protein [Clostridia bacterium]
MAKWIIKNAKAILWIFISLISVAMILCSYFEVMNRVYILVIYIASYPLFIFLMNIIPRFKYTKVIKEYQSTCNPDEYIEYSTLYFNSNPQSPINQMNYAAALSQKRENREKVLEIMLSVNLNKIPPKSTQAFFIYYMNLSGFYLEADNIEKAEECYNLASQFNETISNIQIKLQNSARLSGVACKICIKKNDTQNARMHLLKAPKSNLIFKVVNALDLAHIYILENKTEKAKEQLSFVIQNASQISEGQEAKEILEKIS